MRFLIVGCGSMGKRRARVLRKLGHETILATDVREDRLHEMTTQIPGVKVYQEFEEALDPGVDLALICVPPHLHAGYLERCVDAGLPAFCEAPLVLTLEDMDRVIDASRSHGTFIAPSCTYLHNEIHQEIKQLLTEGRIGKPLAFLSHVGHHVANWHPYEDYRTFYASKRAQGGMCIDMLPHEFQALQYFLGEVRGLTCMARMRSTTIETDEGACDVFDVILDMATGVSAIVHEDMFQRPYGDYRKIMGEGGAIEWNWKSLRLCEYTGTQMHDEPHWEQLPLPDGYEFENAYVTEIAHVLRALEGKEGYFMPLEKERRILELILACENSSQKGIHLTWER